MKNRLRKIYYGLVMLSVLAGGIASVRVGREPVGLWVLGVIEFLLFLSLLCITWRKRKAYPEWEAVCFCLGGVLLLIRCLGYGILTDFHYGEVGKFFTLQAGVLLPGYVVVRILDLTLQAKQELIWQKEEAQQEREKQTEEGQETRQKGKEAERVRPWRAVHTPLAKRLFQRLNKKNGKSGRLLYIGSTLSCGCMLTTIALYMSFRAFQTGKGRAEGELAGFLFHGIVFMSMISVLILALALKPYVRGRKRDYLLMYTLGIPKGVLNLWILKEYVKIQTLGVISGYLLGSIWYGVIQAFFRKWYPAYAGDGIPSLSTYLITLVCVVVLLVYSTFINYEIYTETELGNQGKAIEKDRFRGAGKSPYAILTGLLLLTIACFGYQWRTVRESAYFLMVAVTGMILAAFGGASVYLAKRQKNPVRYFGKLPAFYSFYAHYKKYRRQGMALFALHFFFFAFLLIRGMSLFPLKEIGGQFPYDYVLLGDAKETMRDLADRYGLKGTEVPMVRLTVPSVNENNGGSRMDISFQGQQIGLSEETYRELTGKSLGLSGKEIAIFFQQGKGEVAHPLDFTTLYGSPRIRVGTPRHYLWYERDKEFDRSYQLVSEMRQQILGPLAEGRQEQILIFSDTYFQKVYAEGKFPCYLGMYRLTDRTDRKELKRILKTYQETYQDYSSYDSSIRAVYEKQELTEKTESFYLLKLSVYGFLGILFQACVCYVMVWRYTTDAEEWADRMEKYKRLGMKQRDREAILRREHGLPCQMALILAICMSVLFGWLTTRVRFFSVEEVAVFWRFVGGGILVYAAVQWGMICCFTAAIKNRVGGKIR